MDHLVNDLMDEAIACARHLDKEGMGYSADVVRRAARAISDANREHDQDVARMERAAEAIESLTARCEELERDSGRLSYVYYHERNGGLSLSPGFFPTLERWKHAIDTDIALFRKPDAALASGEET